MTPIKKLSIGQHDISLYRIVMAENAIDYTQNATKELAKYIQLATGIELAIVCDDQPAEDFEFLVGNTNRDTEKTQKRLATLKNDGIMMYAVEGGKKLYLNSCSEAGVGYAVCRFLKNQLGVHVYEYNHASKFGYEICEQDNVCVPGDLDYTHSPQFRYRRTDLHLWNETLIHWQGVNSGRTPNTSYYPTWAKYEGVHHSWDLLYGDNSTPCLTDDRTFGIVLNTLKKWVEENPEIKYFQVTLPDSSDVCNCEKCQAMREKEGQAGITLAFVNRLAEAITKEHPDVFLQTFAYGPTIAPPASIKPHDNVIVWIAPISRCFSHRIDDPTCEMNATMAGYIKRWAEISKHFMIWDYCGCTWENSFTAFPDIMNLYHFAKFYAECGSEGLFVQIDRAGKEWNSDNGKFWDLESYLLGELLWNPTMTEEEYRSLMKGFLKFHYGAGWEYIYEYIDRADKKWKNRHVLSIIYCMVDDGPLFRRDDEPEKWDYEFCEEMNDLWTKAVEAATDERTRYNCENSKCQIDYIMLIIHFDKTNKINFQGAKDLIAKYERQGHYHINDSDVFYTLPYFNVYPYLPPLTWRHYHQIMSPQSWLGRDYVFRADKPKEE